jgi:hypothetical protein
MPFLVAGRKPASQPFFLNPQSYESAVNSLFGLFRVAGRSRAVSENRGGRFAPQSPSFHSHSRLLAAERGNPRLRGENNRRSLTP